jgi:hypothetical protein
MPDDDSESEHPTSAAKANAEKAKDKDSSSRNKRLITGAAIGIGSAALVAALLYANRARKSDRS